MKRRELFRASVVAAVAALLPRRAVALLPATVSGPVTKEQRALSLAVFPIPAYTVVCQVALQGLRYDGGVTTPFVSVVGTPLALRPGDILELRIIPRVGQ